MPFVCTPRIVNGSSSGSPQGVSLQITDLFPHKTQSNAVLTPRFQGPTYIYAHSRAITATPVLDADFDVDGDVSGLAAYILATIENSADVNNIALTAAQAVNIANDLIAIMEAGEPLTEEVINAEIANRTGGENGIGIGNSTATVLQILQIISGYKVFTLPDGTSIADETADDAFEAPAVDGFFTDPADVASLWSNFTGTFYISAKSGQLKKAQTRRDANGNKAPYVVCYADDGTLIQ